MIFIGNLLIQQYDITSPVLKSGQKIAYLGDVHGESQLLEKIIDTLKELRISTLLIGGDLVDYASDYEKNNKLKELLQELDKNIRVFVSYGNHDILNFDGKHWVKSKDLSFWNGLSSLNNIHLANYPKEEPTITKWSLNNEIDVCSLCLPAEHFLNKESCEEFRNILEMIENFDVNLKKYNILLCHSPLNIAKSEVIDEFLNYLKQFNIILSSHMHAGLMPNFFRRKTCGWGIVGPYNRPLPEYAYGLNNYNDVSILTSGGVVKVSDSAMPDLLKDNRLFDEMLYFIFPSELEILNFHPGNTDKIEKVLSKKNFL